MPGLISFIMTDCVCVDVAATSFMVSGESNFAFLCPSVDLFFVRGRLAVHLLGLGK